MKGNERWSKEEQREEQLDLPLESPQESETLEHFLFLINKRPVSMLTGFHEKYPIRADSFLKVPSIIEALLERAEGEFYHHNFEQGRALILFGSLEDREDEFFNKAFNQRIDESDPKSSKLSLFVTALSRFNSKNKRKLVVSVDNKINIRNYMEKNGRLLMDNSIVYSLSPGGSKGDASKKVTDEFSDFINECLETESK